MDTKDQPSTMKQEPATVTADTQRPAEKKLSWESKVIGVLILILLLLVAGAAIIRYKQPVKNKVSPYKPAAAITSASYKSLTDETLKSGNDSLTFKRPVDLEKLSETKSPVGINFAKYSGPNGLLPYISYLSATLIPNKDSPLTPDQLQQGLAPASDPSGQTAMNNLKDYINVRKIAFYGSLAIDSPRATTVSGAPAWETDFTLSSSTSAITPKVDHPANAPLSQQGKSTPTIKTPDYKGKIVVIPGKSSIYYFMVYDLSSNWQTNQDTWVQVINSLKVN